MKERPTAPPKRDIPRLAPSRELEINRRIMRRKRQPRRDIITLARLIRQRAVLLHGKLLPHPQPIPIRDLTRVPNREAVRVAVVVVGRSINVDSFIKIAKKVELLSGVVLPDVLPVSRHPVHAVFHGVYPARPGVFCHADAIPQPPAENVTVGVEVVRAFRVRAVGDVKDSNLGEAGREDGSAVAVGFCAAAGDDELALDFFRDEEGAGDEVVVAHVGDEGARLQGDGTAAGVVGPGKYGFGGGGVEDVPFVGQGEAMVELFEASEVWFYKEEMWDSKHTPWSSTNMWEWLAWRHVPPLSVNL